MPRTGNDRTGWNLNCIPFAIKGKVNNGINPNVADVKIPKANPFKLFIVFFLVKRLQR